MNFSCLIIGINEYYHINSLPNSVINDALNIFHTFQGKKTILKNKDASKENIMTHLDNVANQSKSDNTTLIYFTGHGAQINSDNIKQYYLLPINASYSSTKKLVETSISSVEFTKVIRNIKSKRLIIIFDCCHSGGIGQPKNALEPEVKTGLPDSYFQQLAQGRGRVILSSSRQDELSWIMPGDENSLFTKHLLDGLSGKALSVGGVIRIFDLFQYVQEKVREERTDQHPVLKAEVEENFPIALAPEPPMEQSETIVEKTIDDEYQYDLFISYRRLPDDRRWIRTKLIPALEAQGLRVCIDDTCFRLGAPIVTEMERAVQESRFTLGILTPEYSDSGFTELENVMAKHLHGEDGKIRFIGLIYRDHIPRLMNRATLMLDMTEDFDFEPNIKRIVYEVKSPDK